MAACIDWAAMVVDIFEVDGGVVVVVECVFSSLGVVFMVN